MKTKQKNYDKASTVSFFVSLIICQQVRYLKHILSDYIIGVLKYIDPKGIYIC